MQKHTGCALLPRANDLERCAQAFAAITNITRHFFQCLTRFGNAVAEGTHCFERVLVAFQLITRALCRGTYFFPKLQYDFLSGFSPDPRHFCKIFRVSARDRGAKGFRRCDVEYCKC